MRVWITEISEPLPIDPGERRWRCGQLSAELCGAGHQVTWWHSTFHHLDKRYRYHRPQSVSVAPNYNIHFLHATPYSRNISLARVLNHALLGAEFRIWAEREARPDVIVCAMPTIDLSFAAVHYGKRHGVPVLVDVRDLWPDIFVDVTPAPFKPLTRLALAPEFARIRAVMHGASAISGVSPAFVRWGLNYAGREAGPFDGPFYLGYERRELSPAALRAETEKLIALGVDPGRFVCCYIGLFREKMVELDLVIRVARQLEAEGDRRFQFVFCGQGEMDESWRRQARGLTSVVFTGWLGAEALSALMALSKAGLATYRPGAPLSLPNKPIEYFSGYLPILNSLPGELRELVAERKLGLTYDAGNPESFRRALLELAGNEPLYLAMRQAVQENFHRDFEGRVIYRRYRERLEALVARGA